MNELTIFFILATVAAGILTYFILRSQKKGSK